MRITAKILNHLENKVAKFALSKTYIAECYAILRKRKLYKDIVWSESQQKEFDDFWLANYGRKIPNWWHRLYQQYTGVFNVRYIPEMLYSTVIEPKWNPFIQSKELENKAITELLCKGVVSVPKTLALCDNGIIYSADRRPIDELTMLNSLETAGLCVLKPTKDTGSGRGVRMLNAVGAVDRKSGMYLSDVIKLYGGNWIIQEKIKPSAQLAALYDKAINTFRITTYCVDGKVYHVPCALRIGASGGELDNIHAGGMGVWVHDNGTLASTAYRLGYGDKDERFTHHPDTGVCFDGYKINRFDYVTDAAHKLHGCFPGVRMISWDFTLDESDTPVLIEANIYGQGSWFPQIISGEGLFGENTEKVLAEFKK